MAESGTIWRLEPHSKAKHEILRRYLQAWTPILNQGGFPRLVYIDGFAGPGRYLGGEDGSPLIALKSALNNRRPIRADLYFHFIEADRARSDVLRREVSALSLPPNFHVEIHGAKKFADAYQSVHEDFASRHGRLPPTFAFIDPFGWAGVPLSSISSIMSYTSCEILITFMYEEINRFLSQEAQPANFDQFFGTPDWRDGLTLSGAERNQFLRDLYQQQLRKQAAITFVRFFEMRSPRDATDYYLFYGTNNQLGLRKMKEAMWRVDQSGTFTFSDATDPDQMVMFMSQPDLGILRRAILSKFLGQTAPVGDVESFVVEETAFRETHYKRVLRDLEAEGTLVVPNPPEKRRPGTYASSTLVLRFRSADR